MDNQIVPEIINKCKEKFLILQSIGRAIKIEKQSQSSTPADIIVDDLIPNSVH